jgi:enoyl-[acyl-carrier protein] reductase II
MEAGGHNGNQTTMALLTNVIPEIKIPVIAAGGIVDGRGIAAALVMGAAGVQMGSRFLLSTECTLHPMAKQKIIEATDTDSVLTGFSRGRAVRGLKNSFTDRYLEMELKGAPQIELDHLAAGTSRLAAVDGDVDNGLVQVGQSLNVLRTIKPVKEIFAELVEETTLCLERSRDLI